MAATLDSLPYCAMAEWAEKSGIRRRGARSASGMTASTPFIFASAPSRIARAGCRSLYGCNRLLGGAGMTAGRRFCAPNLARKGAKLRG